MPYYFGRRSSSRSTSTSTFSSSSFSVTTSPKNISRIFGPSRRRNDDANVMTIMNLHRYRNRYHAKNKTSSRLLFNNKSNTGKTKLTMNMVRHTVVLLGLILFLVSFIIAINFHNHHHHQHKTATGLSGQETSSSSSSRTSPPPPSRRKNTVRSAIPDDTATTTTTTVKTARKSPISYSRRRESILDEKTTSKQQSLLQLELQDPQQQLQDFIRNYPNTPGANFIRLLQSNLYNSLQNQNELQRTKACDTYYTTDPSSSSRTPHLSNTNLCYAGVTNHKLALQSLSQSCTHRNVGACIANQTLMEQNTFLHVALVKKDAFVDDSTTTGREGGGGGGWVPSVYDIRHYGPPLQQPPPTTQKESRRTTTTTTTTKSSTIIDNKLIPNLGTSMACLPLVLAGAATVMAAVEEEKEEQQQALPNHKNNVVVELGPYFGLSSKCLVSGIQLVLQHQNNNNNNNKNNKESSSSSKGKNEQNQNKKTTATASDNSNPPSTPPILFFAYDTFSGYDNLQSLRRNDPQTTWVLQDYFPDLLAEEDTTKENVKNKENNDKPIGTTTAIKKKNKPTEEEVNTNFLFLWERAVLPISPNYARGIAGKLTSVLPNKHNNNNLPQLQPTRKSTSSSNLESSSSSSVIGRLLAKDFPKALQDLQQQNKNHNNEAPPVVAEPQQPKVSMLVIDSAKSAKSWNEQLLAVLLSSESESNDNNNSVGVWLEVGTILFLMDFEYVSIQNKQIYGCLRQFLLPIYISWGNKEHWAFVVTSDSGVNLKTDSYCAQYYKQMLVVPRPEDTPDDRTTTTTKVKQQQQQQRQASMMMNTMTKQLEMDLEFVSGGLWRRNNQKSKSKSNNNTTTKTTEDDDAPRSSSPWEETRRQLYDRIVQNLQEKPEHWESLRKLGEEEEI